MPALAQERWLITSIEPTELGSDVFFRDSASLQEVVKLTNDKTDQFTPVVMALDNDQVLVVWSEANGPLSSDLYFSLRNMGHWSQRMKLSSSAEHNSSPTLLQDGMGRVWCFWVGFDGQDDEIFFSVFQQGVWVDAQRLVLEDNDVPDLVPSARLTATGIPQVWWKRFDFETSGYIDVISTMDATDNQSEIKWSKPEKVVINPFKSLPALPRVFHLPEELVDNESVTVHFASSSERVVHLDRLINQQDDAAE